MFISFDKNNYFGNIENNITPTRKPNSPDLVQFVVY